MMSNKTFSDRFIGFIDFCGFKSMVTQSERGEGRSVEEIQELLSLLGNKSVVEAYRARGPRTCPRSACLDKHLSFQLTQVSDSAVVSAEISPAGVINLVSQMWGASLGLLFKGALGSRLN